MLTIFVEVLEFRKDFSVGRKTPFKQSKKLRKSLFKKGFFRARNKS
jgi:hypothetical protein